MRGGDFGVVENESHRVDSLEKSFSAVEGTSGSTRIWVGFWSAGFLALAIDQSTKWAALSYLDPYHPVGIVPGFFDLRLVHNDGAAFSLFPGGRWFFVLVSIAAAFFLPAYQRSLLREGESHWLFPLGLGLIWGGAMGNAVDRVLRTEGLVVDFFHFYWQRYSFPVFNMADSAITVGLGAVLFATLFPTPARRKDRQEEDASDPV